MAAHFGNLEKVINGKRRYSITPHIPGGFVKPEELERIAKVAKKYNATLKFTSGQRILIGHLKEEDILDVWKELDMEPAITSPNSVKNVEICPANMCKRSKYGTIGIGMKLSRKYQREPMPCRTKIGVAGCRNACGSAYSKDIGVIADIDGSLIVTAGGSSGFHPRIADIIDRSLDEEGALDLIDRIVEFYKSSADLGEKLGPFIDRIGLDEFRKNVVKEERLDIINQPTPEDIMIAKAKQANI
ncbi:MAG: NAD(P)/FAD-dependent oxidoreductase [Andreesenia angusta]|nr:NAD(P)/FAD-dependent oxidoreductase [Andreesenia angusta]